MPELPEVEVARRRWVRWLREAPIAEATLVDAAAVRSKASTSPRDAAPEGAARWSALVGRRLTATERRGKRLVLDFAGVRWLQHFGMTGRIVRRPPDAEAPKHARAGVRAGDVSVWFVDPRRFGCLVALAAGDDGFTGLGPDAWTAGWDGAELSDRVGGRGKIKEALMDQARVAGLGNIQVAEILFAARVHPRTRSDELPAEAWARIAGALEPALSHAVRATDGAGDVVYLRDGGDNPFAVYGRDGEPCVRCGAPIQRWTQGGRVTYACGRCQPLA